ncbi:MAG TPA: PadR family transcriptional regulator [Leptolyngbyaceae cyanobacterium]
MARAGPLTHDKHDVESRWELLPQKELLLLWAVWRSGERGVYGLDIQRAISECSGGSEEVSVGTLYSLLKRLRKRGLIDSYEGAALGGGAKRHYYYLTDEGTAIAESTAEFFNRLQTWLPCNGTV